MSQDFEDMKNARIASKQRLEQRFINIYKYWALYQFFNCL
jgi:hypothetical protein